MAKMINKIIANKYSIINLKKLRENIDVYINALEKEKSFLIVRKSKPVFKISSLEEIDELWEQVIDFTKMRKGGIVINQLLSCL